MRGQRRSRGPDDDANDTSRARDLSNRDKQTHTRAPAVGADKEAHGHLCPFAKVTFHSCAPGTWSAEAAERTCGRTRCCCAGEEQGVERAAIPHNAPRGVYVSDERTRNAVSTTGLSGTRSSVASLIR